MSLLFSGRKTAVFEWNRNEIFFRLMITYVKMRKITAHNPELQSSFNQLVTDDQHGSYQLSKLVDASNERLRTQMAIRVVGEVGSGELCEHEDSMCLRHQSSLRSTTRLENSCSPRVRVLCSLSDNR